MILLTELFEKNWSLWKLVKVDHSGRSLGSRGLIIHSETSVADISRWHVAELAPRLLLKCIESVYWTVISTKHCFCELVSLHYIFTSLFFGSQNSRTVKAALQRFFKSSFLFIKYWHEVYILEVKMTRTLTYQLNLPHEIDLRPASKNRHMTWTSQF